MKALRRLSALAVLAALAVTVAPAAYSSSSVIGRYAPASVTCDPITNEVKIQAKLGAGDAYATGTQRLAYQLSYYNAATKKWMPLFINGQSWHVIDHTRQQRILVENMFWTTSDMPLAPTPLLTYTFPGTHYKGDGTYYVAARYIWLHNGVWLDRNGYRFTDNSPWEYTTVYNTMLGTDTACRI